jgi:hypothetical protein
MNTLFATLGLTAITVAQLVNQPTLTVEPVPVQKTLAVVEAPMSPQTRAIVRDFDSLILNGYIDFDLVVAPITAPEPASYNPQTQSTVKLQGN